MGLYPDHLLLGSPLRRNGTHSPSTLPHPPDLARSSRVPLESLSGAVIGGSSSSSGRRRLLAAMAPSHAALLEEHAPYVVRGGATRLAASGQSVQRGGAPSRRVGRSSAGLGESRRAARAAPK